MSKALTVKELAELLQVTQRTIYNHIKSGALPYKKVGSQYRFTESDIKTWIESN